MTAVADPHWSDAVAGPAYTFVEPYSPPPFLVYPQVANLRRTANVLAGVQAWLSRTDNDTVPLSSITINPREQAA